jgi:hypothetical protein
MTHIIQNVPRLSTSSTGIYARMELDGDYLFDFASYNNFKTIKVLIRV